MAQSPPDELLRRALALPPEERLALATELLNSVEEPDENWTQAWLAELDRRSAAIDRGEDKLENWETVKARLRAELRSR